MIGALLLMAFVASPDDNPLARAEKGELQCYTPDVKRRTCRALAGYARQGDGSYLNTARVLVDPARNMAMETIVTVEVTPEGVCGEVHRQDILAGKLVVGGVFQSDPIALPMLRQIADAESVAGMHGKMICTRYVANGPGVLKALVSVDGAYRAEWDDQVMWVRPDQGYRVAP